MRNTELTDDDARTEHEKSREDLPIYDPTVFGAALEREAPSGRNWATLLILLSILLVQVLGIGLVIWAIFW